MTHTRYWSLTLATALSGGFLAIERFAFPAMTAKWVAFGVAIGATTFALAAASVGLVRANRAFSGLSALAAAAAAWTTIAMVLFATGTAIWLAFAGGVVLLTDSLAALAVHEATVERIVYALDGGMAIAPAGSGQVATTSLTKPASAVPGSVISPPMRSWGYWLAHTALATTGAFVVLLTFAYRAAGSGVSLRWLAFAIALAAAATALVAMLLAGLGHERLRSRDGTPSGRPGGLFVSGLSLAAAVALIVTMPIYAGATARWLAFAIGCGLSGTSLVALSVHETTSERVRHELEVAAPAQSSATPASLPTAPVGGQ